MGNTIHVSRTHKGNSPIILVPLLPRSMKKRGGESWVNLFKGGGVCRATPQARGVAALYIVVNTPLHRGRVDFFSAGVVCPSGEHVGRLLLSHLGAPETQQIMFLMVNLKIIFAPKRGIRTAFFVWSVLPQGRCNRPRFLVRSQGGKTPAEFSLKTYMNDCFIGFKRKMCYPRTFSR